MTSSHLKQLLRKDYFVVSIANNFKQIVKQLIRVSLKSGPKLVELGKGFSVATLAAFMPLMCVLYVDELQRKSTIVK